MLDEVTDNTPQKFRNLDAVVENLQKSGVLN